MLFRIIIEENSHRLFYSLLQPMNIYWDKLGHKIQRTLKLLMQMIFLLDENEVYSLSFLKRSNNHRLDYFLALILLSSSHRHEYI